MAIGRSENYRKVHQGILEEVIRKIFDAGTNNIVTNARKESTIKSPFSSYFLELDIWVSNLNICFEFQDDYHYAPTWYSQIPLSQIQEHDSVKRDSLIKKSIDLIIVPCWWDGEEKSLLSTIRWHRPDLFGFPRPNDPLIPFNPPKDFFDDSYIPDVGKLMLSSFTATSEFGNSISAKNYWWVGEKYDGLRVCWHPFHKTLYSRSGNKLEIPQSFCNQFPKAFIDSELWFGRENFIEAQGVLYPSDVVTDWASLRIVSFDDSRSAEEDTEFEHRYHHILDLIHLHHPFITLAMRVKGTSKQQLTTFLKIIINEKGEGVILRLPRSTYVRGRSPSLIKLKASRADKEGLVMKVNKGSLTLMQSDGVTFDVPTESISVKRWPKKGEIVSFSYDNYSRFSVPVNAKVYRIRKDVSWQDVINNDTSTHRLNEISKNATGIKSESLGFRHSEKGRNLRAILEKFARSNNVDPLVAESWYNLGQKFLLMKNARPLLARFKGSFIAAVIKTFPEISFVETKFRTAPRNYWNSVQNKRAFMTRFAVLKGFDPLVAENWYSITPQEFMGVKGARTLLRQTNFPKTLKNAFPEIGIQSVRFSDYPHRFYLNSNNRKKFFLDFAKYHSFDPLVASNWYSVSQAQILQDQGEYALQHYNGNFVKALCVLFPQLHFEESKFIDAPKKYISVPEATKRFFTQFADSQQFDPLIPDNWYSVPTSVIMAFKGAPEIMHHYGKSVIKGLMSVYPNIEEERFATVPRQYWSDKNRRRQFFVDFADKHGFDPLVVENWYPITTPMFFNTKGYSLLGKYYKKSVKIALEDVFPELKFDKSKFVQLL